MPTRRYDTKSIRALIERARRHNDRGVSDTDVDYLIDALEHYHQAYAAANQHEEQLEAAITRIRNGLKTMVQALVDLPDH